MVQRSRLVVSFLFVVIVLMGCQAIPAVPPPSEAPVSAPAADAVMITSTVTSTVTSAVTSTAIAAVPATAIAPVTATVSAPIAALAVSFDQLEEACKSYMDVNLQEAYKRFQSPIFWTFHTNFYQPNDAQPESRLGCLRFYWRDNTLETFTGTLKSAMATECTVVNGPLETDPSPTFIRSSGGLRAPDDPTLPHRTSTFGGGVYVECPIDINASLGELVLTQGFDEDLNLLPVEDRDLVTAEVPNMEANPNQEYGEFMMAASLAHGDEIQTSSILYYAPDFDPTANSARPVELSLITLPENNGYLYATELGEWQVDSTASDDGELCRREFEEYYLWASFGQCELADDDDCESSEQDSYLQFLTKPNSTGALAQCRIEDSPMVIPAVPFWIGPATLYIGFNPVTEEKVDEALTIHEAWLDPDSAVKPTDG